MAIALRGRRGRRIAPFGNVALAALIATRSEREASLSRRMARSYDLDQARRHARKANFLAGSHGCGLQPARKELPLCTPNVELHEDPVTAGSTWMLPTGRHHRMASFSKQIPNVNI